MRKDWLKDLDAFSVWTQFTVQTSKRSGHPRGMPLVTRMFASVNMRGIQWYPRVCISAEKRTPYIQPGSSDKM
jgi:hypothetical protein